MPRGVYVRCIRCKHKKARYKSSCNFCLTEQEQEIRRKDIQRSWRAGMKVASDLAVESFFRPSPLWKLVTKTIPVLLLLYIRLDMLQ